MEPRPVTAGHGVLHNQPLQRRRRASRSWWFERWSAAGGAADGHAVSRL